MDLDFTPAQRRFRSEARDWLRSRVPTAKLASYDTREGFEQHRAWEATLAEGGWSSVIWPKELGGKGCDLIEWLIFEEEYHAADAPMRVNQNGILLLGPTLMEFGTPEQKARFLPRMARCDDMWAQGWSEPNAGSDMAAISSRAIRDGDEYVLNGQKTWSTRALYANWLFGLFRSDPQSSRHHGLSYLLVPLDAKGITIRPIKALNGKQAFAEVFFDDVRVSVANRIGDEGQGFRCILQGMNPERILIAAEAVGLGQAALARATRYAGEREVFGRPIGQNQAIQHPLAECWMQLEAAMLMVWKAASRYDRGLPCGAEANAAKYLAAEAGHQACLQAVMTHGGYGYAKAYHVERYLRESLIPRLAPISPQLVLCHIAEKVLGLPKSY